VRTAIVVVLGLIAQSAAAQTEEPLAPLYRRIARDLGAGRPLVVTAHVALCDNGIIWCGYRGMGDGDRPRRNLYWGGAGLRAWFDRAAAGYRRVHLDAGDGETVLERAVWRRSVRPSAAWRRLGVEKPFEVLLVAIAYRGKRIREATDAFVREVAAERGGELRLRDGRSLEIGGRGHVVGYLGHNHLMEAWDYRFPASSRKAPLGYFALSCLNAPYLARPLRSRATRALLVTQSLMFPGPFVVEGLLAGLAAGAPQREVYARGVELYARHQKRPERAIRWAFLHDGERRFARRYLFAISIR
jgi:hypothetical protein